MSPSHKSLETRFLEKSEYDAWRRLVDSAPAGSIYSYPQYLEVLSEVAGGSFRILAALKGDEIQGGIALYERQGAGGKVLSGRLLLYYNGFVLRSFEGKYPSVNSSRELAILSSLEGALREQRYAHVNIRNRHPVHDLRAFGTKGWSAEPSYSLILRLEDINAAYGRVEQNQRRLIRRCEEEGASAVSDDDFESFYRMHLGTHDRKGAPVYLPEEAFARYFRRLSDLGLCRLYHVRLKDGHPVASQLVLLGGHPVTHTVTAAADPEFLGLGTTPFLRWKVCEALAAEGYLGNDLTDASLNEVTRFKSQLGGELVTNLVLLRTDSRRYRWNRKATRLYWRSRGVLGGAYRALMRRRPSE